MSFLNSLLFTLPSETAHNFVKATSKFAPLSLWQKQNQILDPCLKFKKQNLEFQNPIGLAAGFDKEATLLPFAKALGFGFSELGSVTALACSGQKRPRIFRLQKDKSLLNWMGLPNPGASSFAKTLKHNSCDLPFGINIAKTPDFVFEQNHQNTIKGIDDFLKTLETVFAFGNYISFNLSCPNSKEKTLFESPELFLDLAREVANFRKSQNQNKACFIKISPNLKKQELQKTLEIACQFNFDGFIVSNTTSSRPELKTHLSKMQQQKGGLSGKALFEEANNQLKIVSDIIQDEKIIIGVGGITNFASLLQKLQNGSHLIQVYTGLIYGGLRFVKNLNLELKNFCNQHKINNYQQLIRNPELIQLASKTN